MSKLTKADVTEAIDAFEKSGNEQLVSMAQDLHQFCGVLRRAVQSIEEKDD